MQQRNINIYYVLRIVISNSFATGNWIFFWTRFMTYGQLGVVDSLAFAFGLFMEIPTGAVSDMIGKKRTLIASMSLAGIGLLIISAATGMTALIVGFFMAQTGWALFSGAAEALVYDTLKQHNEESRFETVITVASRFSIITVVITVLLGGILYNIHWRLPHYAWGFSFVLGAVAALFIIEPQAETETFSMRGYFNQLGQGFRQLAQPALRRYVLLIFALLGIFHMFRTGIVQPALAVSFGYLADEQAVLQAVLGIMAAITVSYIPAFRRRFSDMQGLALLALLLGSGFMLSALPLAFWGFVPFMMIRLAGELANPWVSVVLNREIPSKYRATTLSTVALFSNVPYVATAIIAGIMIENGTLWLFNLLTGAFVFMALVSTLVYMIFKSRRTPLLQSPVE